MREIAQEHPATYMKFHKGMHALQAILIEPRCTPPEVIVLYGETGSGKSTTTREITSTAWAWGPQRGAWFDGYEGHKHALF